MFNFLWWIIVWAIVMRVMHKKDTRQTIMLVKNVNVQYNTSNTASIGGNIQWHNETKPHTCMHVLIIFPCQTTGSNTNQNVSCV